MKYTYVECTFNFYYDWVGFTIYIEEIIFKIYSVFIDTRNFIFIDVSFENNIWISISDKQVELYLIICKKKND